MDHSKTGFGVIVYHCKKDGDEKVPPTKKNVDPILFLSKTLSQAEGRYWPTELEMAGLVWTVRRIAHLMKSSKHPIVIYMDHGANAAIANQTKLSTTSIDRLNMKLVRASTYLSQFRVEVKHRPGKTNIMPDALSRLPAKTINSEVILDQPGFAHHTENGILLQLSPEFKKSLIQGYSEDKSWADIKTMLTNLNNRLTKESDSPETIHTGVEFKMQDDLIYHVKDDLSRLCIPANVEKQIFEEAHDGNMHAGHARAYERLARTVFIPRLSRKLRQYIKHCPTCDLNQTKRHAPYGELMPISTPTLPFRTIAMDFILALLGEYNTVLTVTDKTTRRKTLLLGQDTTTAEQWRDKVLERLLVADWGIPEGIISDRDRKWMSSFWKGLFNRLGTKLLASTAYHPQTDGLSERTNQTVEIALRFLIAQNPEIEISKALPALQASLNNSTTSTTGKSPTELMYGCKVRDAISAMSSVSNDQPSENPEEDVFKDTRLEFAKEAADATAFANAKAKIYYDSRHKPLLLKPGDEAYIRLHKGYNLPGKVSKKLGNQRCGPFPVVRRVGRLAYELKIPARWKFTR